MMRVFAAAALCCAAGASGSPVGREAVAQGGALDASFLWEGCDVPYLVAENEFMQDGDERLARAFQMWNDELPGMRFRKAQSTDTSYLKFVGTSGGGGSSPLGRQHNMPNTVTIGVDCGVGCTAHEIGHSLGLNHEQCRSDRDSFVTVVDSRVFSGSKHNFHKYSLAEGQDLLPYDYDSLMHYEPYAFTTNKKKTILSPRRIGQRFKPSKRDGEAIRFMYNNCQKPAAPKCVASVETGTRIAHRKYFQVTFVAISGSSVGVTGISALSARGTGWLQAGLPDGAYLTPSEHGGNGHYHSAGAVQWGPPRVSTATRHRLAVRFENAQKQAATCEVEVEVVPTSAVCFGKAAEDPDVCGGNGRCTGVAHAPCECNEGRDGPECEGYTYCTQNYAFGFEDEAAFMQAMSWRSGASHTTARAASGSRSLEVRGRTSVSTWDARYRPTRVRFSAAVPLREGSLDFVMYSSTGTCARMGYDHASGEIRSTYDTMVKRTEHLRWYAFELVMDWSTKTAQWMVDGRQVLQVEIGCDYSAQIGFVTSPVHAQLIGAEEDPLYLDDMAFDCYGPNAPLPSPVAGGAPTTPAVPLPPPTPIPVPHEHWCQGQYRMVETRRQGTYSYAGDDSGRACWRIECPDGYLMLTWADFSLQTELHVTDTDGKGTVSTSKAPEGRWLRTSATLRLDSASGSRFSVTWKCVSRDDTPAPAPVPTTAGPVSGCQDLTLPNGQAWHELMGPRYDCKYYAETAGACAQYGAEEGYRNTHTGSEACCVCGGGSTAPAPAPVPLPPVTVPEPETKCTDFVQADGTKWHLADSEGYDCKWYASVPTYCRDFGTRSRNKYIANEACCACGGGSK
eukprot:TRINITY_DN806_c0_g1_i2.p1 TRINITY_DN806_c0_g1~~TRINITY_DN806_c0_g1_i2.p1  ORF type:complete len:847 (+),score=274.47 TRINITY_DN806_c0_g1_i2:79-2619(+)